MKVRIKQRPSGAYNGAAWPEAGEVIDLPDHVAEGMLRAGQVAPVERAEKVETATPPQTGVETAVKKTTTRKRS